MYYTAICTKCLEVYSFQVIEGAVATVRQEEFHICSQSSAASQAEAPCLSD